jgi:hypothetical protein
MQTFTVVEANDIGGDIDRWYLSSQRTLARIPASLMLFLNPPSPVL